MAYSDSQKTMIVNDICRRIGNENESVRNILSTKGYPSSSIFYEWIDSDEKKLEQYTRAKLRSAEVMDDEILSIADDTSNDTYVDKDLIKKPNAAAIQRSRLRIDARNTLKAQRNLKKYGAKADLTSGGETINHAPINIIMPDGLSLDLGGLKGNK